MKFTIHKQEKTERKIIDVSNMSDEEFNELINQRKMEVEEISRNINIKVDSIKSMIDDNYLSDNKLKHLIRNHSSAWFTVWSTLLIILLVMAPTTNKTSLHLLTENKFYMLIYVIVGLAIAFFVHFLRDQKQKKFAEENYRDCQLFKSDFIKVKKTINTSKYDRELFDYHVVFTDETGKNRKSKINKETYNNYKMSQPSFLYVVKLPKYKSGYFYHTFDPNNIENVSYLKEKSKHYVN